MKTEVVFFTVVALAVLIGMTILTIVVLGNQDEDIPLESIYPFQWSTCGMRSPKPSWLRVNSSEAWEEDVDLSGGSGDSSGGSGGRLIGTKSHDALEGQFPWYLQMVRLVYQDDDRNESRGFFYCGASLIHGERGLTAATCCNFLLDDEAKGTADLHFVAAGRAALRARDAHQWHDAASRPSRYVRPLAGCQAHSQHDLDTAENNIALIWWRGAFQLTKTVGAGGREELITINTVCLPPPLVNFTATLLMAGTGLTTPTDPIRLRYAQIRVTSIPNDLEEEEKIKEESCAPRFPGQYASCRRPGTPEDGAGDDQAVSCDGDQGSPLVSDRIDLDGPIDGTSQMRPLGRPSGRFTLVAIQLFSERDDYLLEDGNTFTNCSFGDYILFSDVWYFHSFVAAGVASRP